MALNVFAFCAIFFLLIALALTGGLIYVQVAKNKPQVGTLVRTTFTGNPAVLTTALWGVSNPTSTDAYTTPERYGENFDHDSINSLHCDFYKGYGTVSTWISDGGINFKNTQRYGFLNTASTLYFDGQTCTQDSDCSVTNIPCGPAARGWNTGVEGNGNRNPTADQCPPGASNTVYCNICLEPFTGQANYCDVPLDTRGRCVNTSENNPLNCKAISTSSSNKYCLSFKSVSENQKVPFNRFNKCSTSGNVGSIGVSGICQFALPGDWYCENTDPTGNVDCGLGQICSANTDSSSGWCPPDEDCPDLETTSQVCTGDIYPNVSINTEWIAEGKVISTDGQTSVVQWERVQNTYLGIGPSPRIWGSTSAIRAQATSDKSWVYSDCRFIDTGAGGRHASVSRALLGTSVTNPSWAPIVDPLRNLATENLLYIGTSTGTIASRPSLQVTPYYRSSWDLRSTDVPNAQLERIWFYSIFPMEGIPAHPLPKLQAAVQVNFDQLDLHEAIRLHGN